MSLLKPLTKVEFRGSAASCRCVSEPPAGEPGQLKPAADRGDSAHVPPDEIVAEIRGLKQNRPLVDSEIVRRNPAVPRVHRACFQLQSLVGEARVKAVLE